MSCVIVSDTGRGLLLTVLGELVLPGGKQAWTQTLIDVLATQQVREKSARQAIARASDRGLLAKEAVGRRTRWRLTEAAEQILHPGAARIYGFGRDTREWDGRWVLLMTSVPERDRNLRYRLATRLQFAGFGSLGGGTWISPWVDQQRAAADIVQAPEHGEIDATSFVAEVGELGSGEALVAQAWDLPELRSGYDQFLAQADRLPTEPVDGESACRELVELVHRWRQFPFIDPDLPAQLLPDDWPGFTAARRFHDLRAARITPTMAWWHARQSAYG